MWQCWSQRLSIKIAIKAPGLHTKTHTHTTVLRPSWILSGTTRVSWHQKGKTDLNLLEQEIMSGSGISWTICKSAPWPRHITMPASHHWIFYRPDAQPKVSKHWRPFTMKYSAGIMVSDEIFFKSIRFDTIIKAFLLKLVIYLIINICNVSKLTVSYYQSRYILR